MPRLGPTPPDWNALYALAASQDGYFSAAQADEVNFSIQDIAHHVRAGKFERVLRGIYRLTQYPPGDHEDLAVAWLWSEGKGVVSHETALALHELSDVMPRSIHLTVPAAWAKRRLRIPKNITLHFNDVPARDRAWFGSVPVTKPARAVRDAKIAHVSPEIIAKAVRDGVGRGMFSRADVRVAPPRNDAAP
ncbi:MAG: hypothetical protein KC417_10745 [Myxococcales bacterium]|nr:hypothetical protein [Myxococcales bacterium]